MLAALLMLPLVGFWSWLRPTYDHADIYVSGRKANPAHVMEAALGGIKRMSLRNYYMEGVIDGGLTFRAGSLVCGAALIATLAFGAVGR
jgi:hypothetical protein